MGIKIYLETLFYINYKYVYSNNHIRARNYKYVIIIYHENVFLLKFSFN